MNRSILGATSLAVAAAAGAGSLAGAKADPRWYARLRQPAYQPPGAAFPLAWTTLYADIAATSRGALTLSPYPLWCGFATVLSTHIWRLNG
ncbi:tryptophan-rich sensory protein [Mycobacterium avium]|uniref:tryptophan-rich sensory protein n=1 Tax=Mycobacterium avium TaxID=1764 RepID=UPI000A038AF2|nr:tryptophan-rich sensory protein [Mycobacterium avium]